MFLVKQVVPLDTIAADSFLRVIQLSGLKERVIVDLFLISNNRKHVCMSRDFFFRFLHDRSVLNRYSVIKFQISNMKILSFEYVKRKWIK